MDSHLSTNHYSLDIWQETLIRLEQIQTQHHYSQIYPSPGPLNERLVPRQQAPSHLSPKLRWPLEPVLFNYHHINWSPNSISSTSRISLKSTPFSLSVTSHTFPENSQFFLHFQQDDPLIHPIWPLLLELHSGPLTLIHSSLRCCRFGLVATHTQALF